MSVFVPAHTPDAIIGQPEVVEDLARGTAWQSLKQAVTELQELQEDDGSLAAEASRERAGELVEAMRASVAELAPSFPHDAEYLAALDRDLARWAEEGFGVPDFYDSLVAFAPASHRADGVAHLVLFPMYTQNGTRAKKFQALITQVMWPEFIAELEREFTNPLFLSLRLIDFTSGYDTDSAVLFPETVTMRAIPPFTWGAIFQDREAARYRRVVKAAAEITRLELPADAQEMLDDQQAATEAFIMWDIIHDRTHMRGDLPFDPFMIKQRMPYFLYTLEEMRCDLTAFGECLKIQRRLEGEAQQRELNELEQTTLINAKRVQYAVIFDRIFRFALTGSRVRNYDGLGGQLLFAWMHKKGVLHWTDTELAFEWDRVADVVAELGEQINTLYWESIDRPKLAHWLKAYELVSGVVEPHPASTWAKGKDALPLTGPLKGMTDLVMDDEFPLSMFYEALAKKMDGVIESTRGITAKDEPDVPASA